MNNKFDELAKGLAHSATRRQAFKKFGLGLAGMALACFGLAERAQAGGGYLCCTYECYTSIMGSKAVKTKVCVQAGSGCPFMGGFCGFARSSRSLADCKTCS
jgi:hypothetical protein